MKEVKPVYEFAHYKDFLTSKVGPRTNRSGLRLAMAQTLQCQPTYVSQVLYGSAHFSLEQAESLAEFLALTSDEKHFFLLLLQKNRAGTKRLEKYFGNQIEQILANRLVITKRMGGENQLTEDQRSVYYSSWQYICVHIALTIPALRTAASLSEHLGISKKRILEILDFLVKCNLARRAGDQFVTGVGEIRLGNSTHHILKHHAHWRTQAIESLEREGLSDLHYSAVVSLSQKDVVRLKEKMLEFLGEILGEIRKSEEEVLYCYLIDFFNMERR